MKIHNMYHHVMCNCMHRHHGRSVSLKAIVVWKPNNWHYIINPRSCLIGFVCLDQNFNVLDLQLSNVASEQVFFHVCLRPIITAPCLICKKQIVTMNYPVSITGPMNCIPGLQACGGFNVSPSKIISSGLNG